MLWNGGIGTYVKASFEENSEVGDKDNDNLRVNAKDLQCKIVGEGGNLGLTQNARIEYAKNGGLINTDFIDNSAGVDCSDHEVNIKIAFEHELKINHISPEERNKILKDLTSVIEKLVLKDNLDQSYLLDIETNSKIRIFKNHIWLMEYLEDMNELLRDVEKLPSKESCSEMQTKKEGLSRPEISVLIAYSKNNITHILNSKDLSSDPYYKKILFSYFPEYIQENFPHIIENHKLKNEIISTIAANQFVNILGCSSFQQFISEQEHDPRKIIKIFYIICDIANVKTTWNTICNADIPHKDKINLLQDIQKAVLYGMRWLLMHYKNAEDAYKLTDIYRTKFEQLSDNLLSPISDIKHFAISGIENVQKLKQIHCLLDIIFISLNTKLTLNLDQSAKLYFKVKERVKIDDVITFLSSFESHDYMEKLMKESLEDDLRKVIIKIIFDKIMVNSRLDIDSYLNQNEKSLKELELYTSKVITKLDDKNCFVLIPMFIKKVQKYLLS